VNLGVGLPTLALSFLASPTKAILQSENGILGMCPYPLDGEVDGDTVNAGKETVTLVAGTSTFDCAESFGMIRGGHVDVAAVGALQVSADGDLANYMVPGKELRSIGGAMNLVANPDCTKVVVATELVAKDGSGKAVRTCDLPLTGARVVSTSIAELCVFEIDRVRGGLTLTEFARGATVEEVRGKTDGELRLRRSLDAWSRAEPVAGHGLGPWTVLRRILHGVDVDGCFESGAEQNKPCKRKRSDGNTEIQTQSKRMPRDPGYSRDALSYTEYPPPTPPPTTIPSCNLTLLPWP